MTAQTVAPRTMPVLYLSHGAPPLADHPTWPKQLAAWSRDLPRPKAILIVSAHWESAPLTIGATKPVPLVYEELRAVAHRFLRHERRSDYKRDDDCYCRAWCNFHRDLMYLRTREARRTRSQKRLSPCSSCLRGL